MDLKYEFYINEKAEKVWDALTKDEYVKKLYFGSKLVSTFKVGDDYQYIGPGVAGENTVHVYGKIIDCVENKSLVLSSYVGQAYGEERKNYGSRVSYNIESLDEVTKLTVSHDQWKENDPSYDNTAKNWWVLLSILKTLLETGELMTFDYDGH